MIFTLVTAFDLQEDLDYLQDLLETMETYQLNSNEGEVICPNHLKIDNTYLSKDEVVDKIISTFHLSDC